MTEYFYNKIPSEFDHPKLNKDILNSSMAAKYVKFSFDGSVVSIEMSSDLTVPEKTELDGIIAANDGTPDLQLLVKKKVLKVMEGGQELIAEFGSENVAMGLSGAQMGALATKYSGVISLLMTGSGNLARATFDAIPADPENGMDQARKDKYLAMIDSMLGSL